MKAMQAYDYRAQLKLKSQEAIIHFDEGLIGFSEFKDYVLMESESLAPFRLLQSLDSAKVGFLVLEAASVIHNYYELVPPREWESLGIKDKAKPLAFVIVVIASSPQASTGNFQAPLLINYERMIGKQMILTDSGLSLRQPLT